MRCIAWPAQKAAIMAVYYAVQSGELVRQPCEKCGSEEQIEAHHDDYTKKLDVRWLCHKCHMAFHASLRPKQRAICGHGLVFALGLCRSCWQKRWLLCNPDIAERRREYTRQWRKDHFEERKEYDRRYQKEHPGARKEKDRRYYEKKRRLVNAS